MLRIKTKWCPRSLGKSFRMRWRQEQPVVKAKGDENPTRHSCVGQLGSFVQCEGQVPDLRRLRREWEVEEWKKHVGDFQNFFW